MHDATEGGCRRALRDSKCQQLVGMEIHEEAFIYPDEVRMVVKAFEQLILSLR